MCAQVVPADYAFVLHTAHPVSGQRGELFGELVLGMGEALVGNHPGGALSFRAASDAPEAPVEARALCMPGTTLAMCHAWP